MRANAITGSGRIRANGESAANTTGGGNDAAGGGGAGGSVYLRTRGTLACNSVEANGGNGGNVNAEEHGPGGGGGGGWILLQGGSISCSASAEGGNAGVQTRAQAIGGRPYGATDGAPATPTILPGPMPSLSAPIITAPADGSHVTEVTVVGTATPGVTVVVIVDGVEVGRVVADGSGNWSLPMPGLPDGEYRVEAAEEAQGLRSATASVTVTVDNVPPDTAITAGPATLSSSASATFSFTSTEAGSTFECSLDGAAFEPCPEQAIFSGLDEGEHTLQVRARDQAGNVDSTPASWTWTVDTIPPDTAIQSGPASPTNSDTAQFQFSSSEPGVTYECRLDGAADFIACSEQATFTDLDDGQHTLEVRARDAAGNVDPTPASFTWTVDTIPPQTHIVAGPALLTNATSATFEFGADETGVTFECSLDGAPFTACTGPATFTDLDEGAHTLQVRARDAAGNVDPNPASFTWTVDRTPPETFIEDGPASLTTSASAAFDFSSDESGVRFECRLDGALDFEPCPEPAVLSGLADGVHQLQVRAVDGAGNADPTPASWSWVVDTTAPETFIDLAPPPVSNSPDAGFAFRSDDPTATFECSFDGVTFVPCSEAHTVGPLDDGDYALAVRAVDPAGNADPTPAIHT